MLGILRSKEPPSELLDRTEKLWKKAVELAQIRNVIAHNPLEVSWYETAGGGLDVRKRVSRHPTPMHSYTLDDIRKFAIETGDLVVELQNVFSELERELFRRARASRT